MSQATFTLPDLPFDATEIDTDTAHRLIDAGLYTYAPRTYGQQTIGTIHPTTTAHTLLGAPPAAFYRRNASTWRQIRGG
jgi:hypothetical protein